MPETIVDDATAAATALDDYILTVICEAPTEIASSALAELRAARESLDRAADLLAG